MDVYEEAQFSLVDNQKQIDRVREAAKFHFYIKLVGII